MAQSLASDLLVQAGLLEGAFTIDEFCRAFRISRSMFYKLRKNGQAPVVMDAGKPLISFAAAAEWRRARETDASASAE
jgi:hypothetical protein